MLPSRIIFVALAVCAPACAAITIDPGMVGATNVTPTYDGSDPWVISSDLTVGSSSSGSIAITEGSVVESGDGDIASLASATGVVAVSGGGSSWRTADGGASEIRVGFSGDGTLNVLDGGHVGSSRAFIAYNRSSQSTASVIGAGSTWDNTDGAGDFYVAWAGGDELDIADGGQLITKRGFIGRTSLSSGETRIDGAGSSWISADELQVGVSDQGTLTISNGGVAHTSSGFIGFNGRALLNSNTSVITRGDGLVTVTGAGSRFISDTLTVGGATPGRIGADGYLSILNGGLVDSPSAAFIGRSETATGSVSVAGAGSTWNSKSVTLGGQDDAPLGRGTLDVTDHGVVRVDEAIKVLGASRVLLDGGLIVAETIQANSSGFDFISGMLSIDSFAGTLLQAGGALSHNSPRGTISISDDYQLNAGELAIRIGGLTQSNEYDLVDVSGNASLAGDLRLSVIDGFSPSPGDRFQILQAFSVIGSFASNTFRTNSGGFQVDWNVLYDSDSVHVEATSVIDMPGDFDGDGSIGVEDYQAWRQFYGSADELAADGNRDGVVDAADYTVWRDAYAAAFQAASVPEPTSLGCLALVYICCGAMRRCKRRVAGFSQEGDAGGSHEDDRSVNADADSLADSCYLQG